MSINVDLQIHCSWFRYQDLRDTNVEREQVWVASFKANYIN